MDVPTETIKEYFQPLYNRMLFSSNVQLSHDQLRNYEHVIKGILRAIASQFGEYQFNLSSTPIKVRELKASALIPFAYVVKRLAKSEIFNASEVDEICQLISTALPAIQHPNKGFKKLPKELLTEAKQLLMVSTDDTSLSKQLLELCYSDLKSDLLNVAHAKNSTEIKQKIRLIREYRTLTCIKNFRIYISKHQNEYKRACNQMEPLFFFMEQFQIDSALNTLSEAQLKLHSYISFLFDVTDGAVIEQQIAFDATPKTLAKVLQHLKALGAIFTTFMSEWNSHYEALMLSSPLEIFKKVHCDTIASQNIHSIMGALIADFNALHSTALDAYLNTVDDARLLFYPLRIHGKLETRNLYDEIANLCVENGPDSKMTLMQNVDALREIDPLLKNLDRTKPASVEQRGKTAKALKAYRFHLCDSFPYKLQINTRCVNGSFFLHTEDEAALLLKEFREYQKVLQNLLQLSMHMSKTCAIALKLECV